MLASLKSQGKEVEVLRIKIVALAALTLIASLVGAQNKTYTVRQGDTISGIASRLKVRRAELVAANSLTNSNKLKLGMTLRVPAREIAATVPAPAKGTSYYAVRNGDSDWTIAKKHGISLKQLHSLNSNVQFKNLQIGTRLMVPGKAKTIIAKGPAISVKSAKVATTASRTYKVQKNENDWVIARKFDSHLKDLKALNPGVNLEKVKVGQTIRVPSKATVVAAVKATSSDRIRTKYAKVMGQGSIIRRNPSTSAEKVTIVDSGTRVAVLDYTNGWYKLRFPKGTVGWMRGDLLQSVKTIDAIRENRTVVAKSTPKATSKPNPVVVASKKSTTKVAVNTVGKKAIAVRAPAKPATKKTVIASVTRKSPSRPVTRVASNRPSQPVASSSRAIGAVSAAQSMLGTRYVWGGTSRGGVDCSGMVQRAYKQIGVNLPRTSRDMSGVGVHVAKSELKPGDLVFFHTGRSSRINHVGIYIGNGKFTHASSGKGRVRTDSLNDGYYQRKFATSKRVLTGSSAASKSSPKKTTVAAKAPSTKGGEQIAAPSEEPGK
ncbi:MAG: NlpC/P60 family protein [Fimbriimonadaceae bacterium]